MALNVHAHLLVHLQMSFPADSRSNEVNDGKKESPEPCLQSSDLADLRQHLSPFLPVTVIPALQDRFFGLKDAGINEKCMYWCARASQHVPATW